MLVGFVYRSSYSILEFTIEGAINNSKIFLITFKCMRHNLLYRLQLNISKTTFRYALSLISVVVVVVVLFFGLLGYSLDSRLWGFLIFVTIIPFLICMVYSEKTKSPQPGLRLSSNILRPLHPLWPYTCHTLHD